jgi:Polyketide cyclase / dehydrase and lipid transport
MSKVEESIDVNVPVRVAYDQWTQFEIFPQFMDGFESITQVDDNTTRLMIQIDWEPSDLVERVGAAVGVDDQRVKADAKRFKEFIESRGTETGGYRGDVPAGGGQS